MAPFYGASCFASPPQNFSSPQRSCPRQSSGPGGVSGGEGPGLQGSPDSAPASESRGGGGGQGGTQALPSPGAALRLRGEAPQRGKGFAEQESPSLRVLLAIPHLWQRPPRQSFPRKNEGLRPLSQILNTHLQHRCLSVHPGVHPHTRGHAHLGPGLLQP